MATCEERLARATFESLKDKVEDIIAQMESALASHTLPTSVLRGRFKNLEKAGTEFKVQYDWLRAIAGENQAEQDHTCLVTLQHRYFEVHARAEDALVNDQNAEDVRLKVLNSKRKVQQYTA